MDLISWRNTLYVSGSVLCGLAYKIIKQYISNNSDISINEVLFYGAKDEDQMKEIGLDNLLHIYCVTALASRTVDVCVPGLESDTLSKCLINVQQYNQAKVRIAIHNSVNFNNLSSFAQHGIEVKVINSAERLEHEFILIDASGSYMHALAVIGALDYETSRVNCNRDSTILTSEPMVVVNLKKEFDRIWQLMPEVTRE